MGEPSPAQPKCHLHLSLSLSLALSRRVMEANADADIEEEKREKRKKREKKGRRLRRRYLFPLLLASASRSRLNPCALPLLRRLLRRLKFKLKDQRRGLPSWLLALFPLLLSSHCSPLSSALSLLRAASLTSLRHNHALASDPALLEALLALLRAAPTPALLAALLDLSVSSFARDRLREAGALPTLL